MATLPYGEALSIKLPLKVEEEVQDKHTRRILVVSDGTWSWFLAVLQVGHPSELIDVLAVTQEAKQNWDRLCQSESLPLKGVTEVSTVRPSEPNRWQMVVMEDGNGLVQSSSELVLEIVSYSPKWVWSGSKSGSKLFHETMGADVGARRSVTHAQLGGSTKARVVIRWGPDEDHKVSLGKISYPKRPSGDWIKLSAPLEFGRKRRVSEVCWSAKSRVLFPWPFPEGGGIVSVPSVFLPGGDETTRQLTTSEQAQLLDLPAHWDAKLVRAIWSWGTGSAIPIRIPVEFLLSATSWYRQERLMSVDRPCRDNSPDGGPNHTLREWAHKANEMLGESKFAVSQTGWLWEPALGSEVTVATKGDGAGIDTTQWDVGGPGKEKARSAIRDWLLTRWRLKLTREALVQYRKAKNSIEESGIPQRFENTKPPLWTDPRFIPALRESVRRSANSTWWEWTDGSILFFWRWPIEWQEEALKGAKAYHTMRPPKRLTARTVPIESELHIELLVEKIKKLIDRRYIVPGDEESVWCVIPFFVVPKGEFDIRVVWSDTENGVNPSIVAPTFFMPLPDTLFRRIPNDAYVGDLDVGEMFHNFPLHPSEQAYAGIRLSAEQAQALGVSNTLFVWDRLLFGWRPSPYFAVRMMTRAVEVAQGDRADKENPFSWDKVKLNLPETTTLENLG